MDAMLTRLKWEIYLAYLNNYIVFSLTWQQHLDCLHQIFQWIWEAGLKLQLQICTLGEPEVDLQGHLVSIDGIRPNPMLLSATRNIPHLSKVISYYRWFVPGFAKTTTPLHKNSTWEWTTACQAEFATLKEQLLMQPIVAYCIQTSLNHLPLHRHLHLQPGGYPSSGTRWQGLDHFLCQPVY